MARKSETFIFKEFIVGLIVLLFFLFVFLFIVRKLTGSDLYRQFFPKQLKNFSATTNDSCGELGFGFTRVSSNKNFVQQMTRSGYQTRESPFVLSVVPASGESFIVETVSTVSEVIQEKQSATCKENQIEFTLGTQLSASVLNVNPDKLSEFASYQVIDPEILLITREARLNGSPWSNRFTLKGGINKTANDGVDTYTCFITEVQGISSLTKVEESEDSPAKGIDTITTNWVATTSASLSQKRLLQECYEDNEYNQSVKVEVEETFVFSEEDGIREFSIVPRSVVGQVSILPNGYIPVSFKNILAPDPTPTTSE